MNIISEQHKKELLEITKNFPADIASLIDYLEEKLQNKIESYKPSQLKDFKFFVMKSFADEINDAKDDNKYIQELLEELQIIWKDLFEEELQGQHIYTLEIGDTTHYTELDFTALNYNNVQNTVEPKFPDFTQQELLSIFSSNIQNNHNNCIPFPKGINLEEQVTIDVLNNLLLLGAYNKCNFFEFNNGSEIYFRLPNNERLAMKVFSLNNQPILKENKLENAILFLSKKINENGDVDYSEGFSADIAEGKINSSYITPLGEIMDF